MKKHILNFLAVSVIGWASYAQTTSDVYHFGTTQDFGTARYQSLGGAFGALGGDLTAVSQNPASSAVFRTSYGGLTVGSNNKDFSSNYFGNTTDTNRNNLTFNQAGGVIILEPSYSNTKVSKIAISLNYQLEADYRNDILFGQDQLNNTIGTYFASNAEGIPFGDLEDVNNFSLTDNFINASELHGARGEQSFLAFNSGIISPNADGNSYFSEAGNNNIQNINIINSGHKSKFTLNGAVQYESGLHIGANINIHQIDRSVRTSFNELSEEANGDFIYDFTYSIEREEFAAGISAGIGLIQKFDNVRIGLSYQTPTWYEFTSETREFTFGNLSENLIRSQAGQAPVANPNNNNPFAVDPDLLIEIPDYGLRTPGKLSASLAVILGKGGLISAQYDRQDLSKTRFDSRFSNNDLINQITNDTFQAVDTYRIGAEARLEEWRFRAGANYSTSPYKNNTIDGESKGFSFGIGYDWGKWKLDGAYTNTQTNYNETPFENNAFSNSGNIDITRNQITVTLGVNF